MHQEIVTLYVLIKTREYYQLFVNQELFQTYFRVDKQLADRVRVAAEKGSKSKVYEYKLILSTLYTLFEVF